MIKNLLIYKLELDDAFLAFRGSWLEMVGSGKKIIPQPYQSLKFESKMTIFSFFL